MSRRSRVARALHGLYKISLSPLLGNRCRFSPSCSDYTLEAIESHGWAKGLWLAAKRVARCNPWCRGGFDEVPRPKTINACCTE